MTAAQEPVPPEVPSSPVGARIFGALAVFFVVLAAVYWFASYEEAGTVLLLLSGGLAVLTGGFLGLLARRGVRDELDPDDYLDHESRFLPHASLRPFWVGMGCVLVAAGLPLGAWLLLPGAVLVVFGLVGLVEEGRRRSH